MHTTVHAEAQKTCSRDDGERVRLEKRAEIRLATVDKTRSNKRAIRGARIHTTNFSNPTLFFHSVRSYEAKENSKKVCFFFNFNFMFDIFVQCLQIFFPFGENVQLRREYRFLNGDNLWIITFVKTCCTVRKVRGLNQF